MENSALIGGDFVWDYGQHWLPQTESAFAPGRVAFGLSGNELLIRAELNDAHVMRDVFPFNSPAFMQCDTFEIFLGPADEKAYYELHVTPSNSVLQLRFGGFDLAEGGRRNSWKINPWKTTWSPSRFSSAKHHLLQRAGASSPGFL